MGRRKNNMSLPFLPNELGQALEVRLGKFVSQ
jgi:hypothetical protein